MILPELLLGRVVAIHLEPTIELIARFENLDRQGKAVQLFASGIIAPSIGGLDIASASLGSAA